MIHETAIVDDCTIGEGTKIWAFSHISSGAVIGNNCVIGEGVHIGPKVVIGNNCKIQNHSILYEGVQLGNNVFIGPNVVTTNDFRPSVEGDWKESYSRRKPQLFGTRYRKYGGARASGYKRAKRTVAQTATGWENPFCLRDDRARYRFLGCQEHRMPGPARR